MQRNVSLSLETPSSMPWCWFSFCVTTRVHFLIFSRFVDLSTTMAADRTRGRHHQCCDCNEGAAWRRCHFWFSQAWSLTRGLPGCLPTAGRPASESPLFPSWTVAGAGSGKTGKRTGRWGWSGGLWSGACLAVAGRPRARARADDCCLVSSPIDGLARLSLTRREVVLCRVARGTAVLCVHCAVLLLNSRSDWRPTSTLHSPSASASPSRRGRLISVLFLPRIHASIQLHP